MKTAEIYALALATTLLVITQPVGADGSDRILARYGILVVDDGETRSLSRGAALKRYRVCMKAEPNAVPLKILHDGQETIVAPGACQLIAARSIRMTSNGKLARGMSLIARRHIDTSIGDSQNAVAGVRQVPAASPGITKTAMRARSD